MLLHGTISFYVEKFDISTDYLRPHSEIATEALNFISLTMNENMGSSFPHYWSLVVEWHFYIAVMLLMPLIKSIFRLQITTAFLLLATLINLNSLFTDNPFGTVNRLFEFIVGVYIALIPYKFKFSNRLVMTIFMLAFIFLLWISPNFFQYSKGNFSRSIIVYGVISGCIVYIASLNKDLMANIPIVGKALFNVGAISYSIYICHITIWNIFQTIIAWHAKSPPLWLHLLILFVSLFTISFLLYKYIEQPMRKIGALLVKKL
jgi:peptidoglycan/LPS O-acetylase OafA/YrhL